MREADPDALETALEWPADATPSGPNAHAKPTPPPSNIAGRYRVNREIGRGGMARVYSVVDEGSQRRLALKLLALPDDARRRAKFCALFEREFHTLAQLSHPRVIEVYDYGVDAAGPYYTMELLDGDDLRERSPLPWKEACALAFDVCSSLALLHSRRLIHRDVSPRNIRCTQAQRAKLIDFGAMAAMGPAAKPIGTPAFIAPEVVHRSILDARTDLFSLGATLYYALTARLPYPAKTMTEVIVAWSVNPSPPSLLTAEIPAELDALVMSLLAIEPALRPRTAFEVMQRLAGIAGLHDVEPLSVSQAYLATPVMLGRDALLLTFRDHMQRALRQQGGAFSIVAGPGLGRSRFLDACALEAKTLGATALRARANGARHVAFAAAEALTEQLVLALPELAHATARELGVAETLFGAAVPAESAPDMQESGARGALARFGLSAAGRVALQGALSRWLLQISEMRPLLIAVDDAHEIDEPSLALLASLAHDAPRHRLLVAVTADDVAAVESAALKVLSDRCFRLELRALDIGETEALFRSLFDDVPNVGLLSARVHAVAGGRPRECMALAQHLLERGQIVYAGGRWTLPEQLDAANLPSSVRDMLRARVAALPPLARFLAEAHALSIDEALSRDDYGTLRPGASPEHLDEAITHLIAQEILSSDGLVYVLRNAELRTELRDGLNEAARRERHHALALLLQQTAKPPMMSVHHLFAAGEDAAALDCLMPLLRATRDWVELMSESRMPLSDVAVTMERALEAAERQRRAPRELSDLRCWLMLLSVTADDRLYWRTAPELLEQLQRDSGLHAWRELSDVSDPMQRVMQALQRAAEQYANTPERERVYRADEAIRTLVSYAAASIPIGARSHASQLIASVPPLLEPFAPLSPALHAMWQNAVAARESNCERRPERARLRWIEVYESLGKMTANQLQGLQLLRNAIAYAIGNLEAQLGIASAVSWAAILDEDPIQRVNAMYLRKVIHLQQGDFENAERFRRHAELIAIQATGRQVFNTLTAELDAHAAARDLTGLKHVMDRIAPLAARYRAWVPFKLLGEGHFNRLRGDLAAARTAFEQGLALAAPDAGDPGRSIYAWPALVAATVEILVELDRYQDAQACGERALSTCCALDIEVAAYGIVRALALAQSKLGDSAGAIARLDSLIDAQRRLGVTGLNLGASYEARARVAIWMGDTRAVERYAGLTAREYRHGSGSPLGARYERLMREAHNAGMGAPQLSEFQSGVVSATTTSDA